MTAKGGERRPHHHARCGDDDGRGDDGGNGATGGGECGDGVRGGRFNTSFWRVITIILLV